MHKPRELVNATHYNSMTRGITGTKFKFISYLELEIRQGHALVIRRL